MRSLVIILFAVTGCGACSAPTLPTDGGIDATPDATPDTSPTDAFQEPASCTPAPRPAYVPAGWARYDDYAPCSGLYVPTSSSELPSPITWQACELAAGASGCRRIQFDWSPLAGQGAVGDAEVDANGHAVVITTRMFGDGQGNYDHSLSLVADADGPVYSAVLATEPKRFDPYVYLPPVSNGKRWLLQVLENQSFATSGYLVGDTSNVAPFGHGRMKSNDSFTVGDLGVLDIGGTVRLLALDSGVPLQAIKGSLPMSFEWMFRSSIFWQGNAGRVSDVGRWDPDAGAVDFVNYGFNPDHAAGDLGTDGVDMVWLEGQGASTDAGPYTSVAYYTSPYVTDPQKLQPKRLRSEVTTAILGTPIAVGCGYAAYAPNGFANGLRIIRLSDGWSWFLPNSSGWTWTHALAVTCTEVFVGVYISGPTTTIARIPVSQLGPGVPPD